MILNNKDSGIPPMALFGLIGAYGPVIAAIIVTQITGGRNALNNLWKKLIQCKVHVKWYLFVLVIPILIYLLSTILSLWGNRSAIDLNILGGISSIPFWFLAALPFGPMGEELGWRGYLLPKLLEKYTIRTSSLLVGAAWGLWHLVSFTFPGAAIPDFMEVNVFSVLLFFCYTISESLVFSYIFFKTNGSVFMAILLHAFFNASSNVAVDMLGKIEEPSLNILIYAVSIMLTALLGVILLYNMKIEKIETST